MMAETDYYDLLGLDRSADAGEIKRAYRKAAMDCHPDRHNGCSDKEQRFKEINEAYDVLKDPQKRAAYDRFGKAAFEGGGPGGGNPFGGGGAGADFSDIFSSIFGEMAGGGRGRARPAPGRGADLRYDLELSLEEAFAGTEKTITVEAMAPCEPCEGNGSAGTSKPVLCETCGGAGKVRAQQGFFLVERGCPGCNGTGQVVADPCNHCNGEGRMLKKRKLSVDIPAGVDDGNRIRVAGEGEAGVRGAPRGDLYLFVHMKRHPIFQREGSTLVADVPVSFTTAALGGEVEVPGVDGNSVEFRIKPGIQSGEALQKRGAGMTVVNGSGRGDMIARVHVETPVKLSKKQKELLEQFRELETGDECPATKGFFGRMKEMFEG
ncbi:molecular chaperone DnaJ [Sphingomicrobium aestuariivivum]|uniref:molecular chaperone DnaJ n=1 Tax=Sphingomicrobium aestuariivivum TaxID=1582356 RepID=UPI0035E3E02D